MDYGNFNENQNVLRVRRAFSQIKRILNIQNAPAAAMQRQICVMCSEQSVTGSMVQRSKMCVTF